MEFCPFTYEAFYPYCYSETEEDDSDFDGKQRSFAIGVEPFGGGFSFTMYFLHCPPCRLGFSAHGISLQL